MSIEYSLDRHRDDPDHRDGSIGKAATGHSEESRAKALRGTGWLAAVAIVVGVGLCGCAGNSGGSGTLQASFTEFPDALDPAIASSAEAWDALQNSYIPLLTYAHASGAAGTRLIPGLARGLPRVSHGGRRYELRLRAGLHYSDGTPIRASDFRFSLQRMLRLNSPGTPFYSEIVGAQRFERRRRGQIAGVWADDRSGQIVIWLARPRATFAYELALPYVALLPPSTPISDRTLHPPAASGPYRIAAVRPGRGWEYRRNPAWAAGNGAAMPQLPGGQLGRIVVSVIGNASTQVNDIEQGHLDWMKGPPPADRLPEIRSRYAGTQFREEPTISNFYFWMNTQRPPFDDLRVRRAVNYALDPRALRRIYAGTMHPTQQVLPPQMPGYRRFRLYPHDLAKARALIAAAAPRDRQVTVWTDNYPTNEEAGEYYEGVLREIGLQPQLKVIDATDYFTVIGNRSTPELDTGWANWLLDYPHPNDYFQAQLAGQSIAARGNTNWAYFNDPRANDQIRRLGRVQLSPSVEARYAALDRAVMRAAPWAPFGNLTLSTFVSSDVDLRAVIFSPIFGQDLTSFQFK
jgi:peptide/nickel transport system substrate-binding protein